MIGLSLRARLTLLNISLMLFVLVPVGIIGYQHEARAIDDLLDSRLSQSARTIAALVSHRARLPVRVERAADADKASKVVSVDVRNADPDVGYQAVDSSGEPIVVTADFRGVPNPTLADVGFRTETFDGTQWRLFTLHGTSGILVRLGERYDTRRDITRSLLLEHGVPLILGLPLLAVLLGFAVQQGLQPLRHLTRLLAARSPGNRQPVVLKDAATELRPLVDTLNLQFERLEDALERERRFNADVAHELRTPLAAAMILIESAATMREPEAASRAISNAQLSLSRLARRIEQILSLARLEIGAAAGASEDCDLLAILKSNIEEFAPLIVDKDVALGLVHDGSDVRVKGHEASISAMFRNLVENALRYAPVGGTVEITLASDGDAVTVDVRDDGPGIPADRREQVFARFHRESDARSDGYGLGLSIVRQAARRHGATITLSDPPSDTGLNVRVVLPRDHGRALQS
jgi:two-component system sensor histidine kinase QseC